LLNQLLLLGPVVDLNLQLFLVVLEGSPVVEIVLFEVVLGFSLKVLGWVDLLNLVFPHMFCFSEKDGISQHGLAGLSSVHFLSVLLVS
jgi:hypothetical protein